LVIFIYGGIESEDPVASTLFEIFKPNIAVRPLKTNKNGIPITRKYLNIILVNLLDFFFSIFFLNLRVDNIHLFKIFLNRLQHAKKRV